MRMSKTVLGIDTSNYTTSAALYRDGEILANFKTLLTVGAGERGLRQSDALFQHTKNLPETLTKIRETLGDGTVCAVGASTRPRNVDGSYMPCFLAGVSAATSFATALGVPLYSFSHQCGHLMAALYSSGAEIPMDQPFGAFHVSGGTTELLYVSSRSREGFAAQIVGGTADLNAGQVIDRIGVAMGLSFPAGPALEQLALQNTKRIPRRKIPLEGFFFNLSGLENLALKLYSETADAPLTAAFVLDYVARALEEIGKAFRQKYGEIPLVYGGGVMSNGIIKERLAAYPHSYFAQPAFSSDNACGIAILAAQAYETE